VSAATVETLRIGDVARAVGTTPRTIRYYEEIGLLPDSTGRPAGRHRCYTAADVDRLREILRLKELLGITLEELRTLLEAEEARAVIRRELPVTDDPGERRALLEQALVHLDRQLALVDRRAAELERLRADLDDRRQRVLARLAE
jgi:DNA-binding transcriptional MerR regulator